MTSLDTYARAGIEALNTKKLEDAIENFSKAVELGPERPDLNHLLGMAYLNRGEAVTALPLLEKACQLAEPFTEPQHADMRKQFEKGLATCFLVLDRVRDAVTVFDRAVDSWPGDLEIRTQRASVLVSSCLIDEGRAAFQGIADDDRFDDEIREVADAIAGSIGAVIDDEAIDGSVFLQGHAEGYAAFFNENAHKLVDEGWYAEAARLVKGADGEPQPMIAEGARSWAVERIDLVNPETNEHAQVGDEKDPHVIAVNGLEPLAQIPVTVPWGGWPFDVWVCSRCPWHWLSVTVQLAEPMPGPERDALLDEVLGPWYLDGYNGSFGETESGRFHYATSPELVGDRAVSWFFDLGRARFDAVPDLLKRLSVLHERVAIERVLFGQGRLPDAR